MNQNDLLVAQPLTITAKSQSLKGALEAGQSYYRLDLEGHSRLSLSLLAQSSLYADLLDTVGTVLQRSAAVDSAAATATPLEAGTYYIRVAADTPTDTSDYTLSLAAVQSNPAADLLWRNTATGATTVWAMNGATKVGERSLASVTDLNWKVAGTADFNNDGQDDLLWRNSATGDNGWWLMKGSEIADVVFLTQVKDLNWNIAGTGDYNGDGQVDILWRNFASGQNLWWLMQGATIAGVADLPGVKDFNWNIVDTADYNRDGQIDLLWRNFATGDNAWWVLKGATIIDTPSLPTVADLNWKPIATTDFNGDGHIDIGWHHSVNGANAMWLMNGTTITEAVALPTSPDANWHLVDFLHPVSPASVVTLVSLTEAPPVLSMNTLASAKVERSAAFSLSDRVNANDRINFYRFGIEQSGIFTASLTGLTGDADVRLIQDKNNSGTIDANEILAWQWERGTTSESIRRFLTAGTYFVQVDSYNAQAANYTLTTNFTAAVSDDQKFSFNLNWNRESLVGLSQAAQNAIAEAATYWEGVIISRSAITKSNQLTVSITGQSMTYSNGAADSGTLALSGPQLTLNGADLAISSGTTTLNTRQFAEFNANPTYLRNIMIHEFAHVLGIGTLWEPVRFRNPDGSIFSVGKTLIDKNNASYNANTYAGWVYGELLGTFTQTAVPIEPQVFAHWDENRFDSELMTPYAEGSSTSTPTSRLTLAALRDLGWNVNMGAAQPYLLSAASVVTALEASTRADKTQAAYKAHCGCASCLVAPSLTTINGSSLAELIQTQTDARSASEVA